MAKRKCNPTSIRLDKELESNLNERCNKLGCSKNDFIKNSVEFMLTGYSEFDFGDEEDNPKESQKVVIKERRIFDCENGFLYEDGNNLGPCSNYNLVSGSVYDKQDNFLGVTRGSLKPTVRSI